MKKKWLLSMPPSPEKVPTDSYFSGKCLKISWFICFTYDPGTFETATSVLGLGVIKFVGRPGPFKAKS